MISPNTLKVWYCPRCDRVTRHDRQDAARCPACGDHRRVLMRDALDAARAHRRETPRLRVVYRERST